MNKMASMIAGAAMMSSSMGLVAEEATGPFAAENFSATLTFTTDYTYRGTTFSDSDPAIQGSFDWGYGAFFAGAWASSTNPTDAKGVGGTMEIDYYFGWADNLGGFDLMLMPLFYTFPGQDGAGARDDFTFELWTSIGRGFEGVPGAPYVNLEVNYSNEFFDNGDDSLYTRISVAFSLPNGFGIDGGYAHTDIGDTNDFFVVDYGHWDVGVSKSHLGFDFDLRYHDNTDEGDIGVGFALDSEVVFSVSRSF